MSIIDKAIPAVKPRTRDAAKVAYMYAIILVVFLLAQLYTFDDFLRLVESFGLPGGIAVAHLLGGIIVASELLALPFLLGMSLSPLMRTFSMGLGWLVPSIWIKLSFWLVLTVNSVPNVGLLGTKVRLMPGWWAVFFCIAIGILAAWASWGLWPFTSKPRSK